MRTGRKPTTKVIPITTPLQDETIIKILAWEDSRTGDKKLYQGQMDQYAELVYRTRQSSATVIRLVKKIRKGEYKMPTKADLLEYRERQIKNLQEINRFLGYSNEDFSLNKS